MTLGTIITILIVGLVIWLIWYLIGWAIPTLRASMAYRIVGAVLAIIYLLWALGRVGVLSGIDL